MEVAAVLGADDRAFFAAVAKTVLANPFSTEPDGIDHLVSQPRPGNGADRRNHYLEILGPLVDARLGGLDSTGSPDLRRYGAEDRRRLEPALLFQTYSRHVNEIDELIESQLRMGEKLAEVPFAGAVLAALADHGFPASEARRYLALFYQLRRGFYFIGRSLVGESESMQVLRRGLWETVFSRDARTYERQLWNRLEDFPALLRGETGTGKGQAAAAIGRSGFIPFDDIRKQFIPSFATTFVAVNLSQFPKSLIESELFGHRRGAFTGAVDNHRGMFERCGTNGALFIDEIGDVPEPVQGKLLRVLQERTFRPLGAAKELRFEGRMIAATNRSLGDLRSAGFLREDFFYRLCSNVIALPPLRQRIEESPKELERLVVLLLERITGGGSPEVNDVVLDALARDLPTGYPWPGNVRELEQAVRRILLTGHYGGDTEGTISRPEEELVRRIRTGALPAKELLGHYCMLLYRRHGTYEEVARRTDLDRRTVRKYVDQMQ